LRIKLGGCCSWADFTPYGGGLGSCRSHVWDLGDVSGPTVVEESLWHAKCAYGTCGVLRRDKTWGVKPGKRQGGHEGVKTLDIEL